MTIEEYCQQILLGESLEDKLLQSDVSLNPYKALKKMPHFPGRSPELSFGIKKSMALPSVHQLEHRKNRGLLLHFFLNHELLALEIMALVLLKFPELPDSYKRSLLKTMQDEQKHASLYINSMKEFGVQPGDMPVNSFFWDCFKNITDPMEFITGMSLTFEQANLDFSLYYKNAFETIGDLSTAAVLDEVYQDEITHVSHGLKWFRKWKKTDLSDWQEYVNSLKLPLSPGRAKGSIFDREGRLKAGFDLDFIDQLEVTSFSRGRPPDIYLFHAFSESYISRGRAYNLPQWGVDLEKDLSLLPIIFAGKDDLLLTCGDAGSQHLAKLIRCGFKLPQIVKKDIASQAKPLRDRSPGQMKPWGWSPEMEHILSPLMKQQTTSQKGWLPANKSLFSKSWAASFAKNLAASEEHEWFKENYSITCQTVEEIKESFALFTGAGHSVVAVKSPLGSSGRDIMRFPGGEIANDQQNRLKNLLKIQGSLLVEPWLSRIADFSAHYQVGKSVKFLGFSRLINDHHGQYSGSLFGKPFHGLDTEVMKLLQKGGTKGINGFYEALGEKLQKKLLDFDYSGPLGIDFFVFRNPEGELRVRPLVEINFRMTMGRLALELEKKLAPGKSGLFKIFSLLSSREKELAKQLVQYSESVLSVNDKGKWVSGLCQLNEWREGLKFPVFISVADHGDDCFSQLGITIGDLEND